MEEPPNIEIERQWPYIVMFGMVNGKNTYLVNFSEYVFASFASYTAVTQWRVISSNNKLLKEICV